MTPEFDLERWAWRVRQTLWAMAAAGSVAFAIGKGWLWAWSFLAGALLAICGFHLTHRFVRSIGAPRASRPGIFRLALFSSRYLVFGGILALLSWLVGLHGPAALCGLLTPAAAVLLAMLLELPGWLGSR